MAPPANEQRYRSGGDNRWLETEDEHRYGRGRAPVGGEYRPFSMATPESPFDLAEIRPAREDAPASGHATA